MHNTSNRRWNCPPNVENNPECMIIMRNGMKLTWSAYQELKKINYNTLAGFAPAYMEE